MPTIATLMLIIGVLTSAAGITIWHTAVTDHDTYNLRSGNRIATAGRWIGTAAILLRLGGDHQFGTAMTVLLLAAAAAATASRQTKPAPQAPRHV